MEGSNAADGRDVVEAEQGGEVFALKQKLLRDGVTKLGGIEVLVELDDEIAGDFERESAGDLHGGLPTALRVGAEGLTVHVGNLAVAEAVEVAEGQLGCAVVIENDVGDSGEVEMAADRDGGC